MVIPSAYNPNTIIAAGYVDPVLPEAPIVAVVYTAVTGLNLGVAQISTSRFPQWI